VPPGHEMSVHYFSCSGGTSAVSIKSTSGHVMSNLCFCIRWKMQVTLYISIHLGHDTVMHYFSSPCGTGTDSTETAPGDITPN
jgi:hypothetical protein